MDAFPVRVSNTPPTLSAARCQPAGCHPQADLPLTTEADALAQACWPAPEVAENVNRDELGNLGLTPMEEAALVAFMKTLSDGYFEP